MRILGMITGLTLAFAATMAPAEERAQITVSGEGRVEAQPDMATITLGVTSQAATAKAAMDETSGKVAALLARLEADQIEPRDIQTTGLSLNPVWEHRTYPSEQPPKITGFVASNAVTVRVRALEGLGGVLDGVLEAGANTFNGLAFGLQEPRPLQDEARRRAVADARAKAELYAAAAGVSLGPILSISEAGGFAPQPQMYRMEAAMASDAVPVAEGEVTVSQAVTIVWALGE